MSLITSPYSVAILWLFLAVSLLIFGIMLVVLVRYHRSQRAVGANFHSSLWVEIIWAVIPLLMFVGLVLPVLDMRATLFRWHQMLLAHEIPKSRISVV